MPHSQWVIHCGFHNTSDPTVIKTNVFSQDMYFNLQMSKFAFTSEFWTGLSLLHRSVGWLGNRNVQVGYITFCLAVITDRKKSPPRKNVLTLNVKEKALVKSYIWCSVYILCCLDLSLPPIYPSIPSPGSPLAGCGWHACHDLRNYSLRNYNVGQISSCGHNCLPLAPLFRTRSNWVNRREGELGSVLCKFLTRNCHFANSW